MLTECVLFFTGSARNFISNSSRLLLIKLLKNRKFSYGGQKLSESKMS
jgi:hypothetical protein